MNIRVLSSCSDHRETTNVEAPAKKKAREIPATPSTWADWSVCLLRIGVNYKPLSPLDQNYKLQGRVAVFQDVVGVNQPVIPIFRIGSEG